MKLYILLTLHPVIITRLKAIIVGWLIIYLPLLANKKLVYMMRLSAE